MFAGANNYLLLQTQTDLNQDFTHSAWHLQQTNNRTSMKPKSQSHNTPDLLWLGKNNFIE